MAQHRGGRAGDSRRSVGFSSRCAPGRTSPRRGWQRGAGAQPHLVPRRDSCRGAQAAGRGLRASCSGCRAPSPRVTPENLLSPGCHACGRAAEGQAAVRATGRCWEGAVRRARHTRGAQDRDFYPGAEHKVQSAVGCSKGCHPWWQTPACSQARHPPGGAKGVFKSDSIFSEGKVSFFHLFSPE